MENRANASVIGGTCGCAAVPRAILAASDDPPQSTLIPTSSPTIASDIWACGAGRRTGGSEADAPSPDAEFAGSGAAMPRF